MNKLSYLLIFCFFSLCGHAGNYKHFRATAYVMVGDINRMATTENWEKSWNEFSKNLKLDKVYLETFRDMTFVDKEAMNAAIAFFKSKGIQVSGGITYNWRGGVRQRWESFCYSNPEHLKIIQDVIETTAALFDEIVLDDYYFTNCKDDLCIEAKGNRSWGEFRRDLLDEVARRYIVGPAHAKNPKCKVLVKYPNWYDHFQGLGFDLSRGPFTFDGVYTGTETRDHRGEQHLQAYESFGIMRYFENIRPRHNFGGWVDTGGASYPDLFSEQLWLTLLSKSPEITLFNYASMSAPFPEMKRSWQGMSPTLNMDELKSESAKRGVTRPTWGRIAEYAYRKVDEVLGYLGTPKGIQAYKPYNSQGEDFLHNYMGMMGVPVEIVPEFPTDTRLIILAECAKYDPDILSKMIGHLRKGDDLVVTSGFYRAMQNKGIKTIFEMEATDRKVDVDTIMTVGSYGQPLTVERAATTIKMPVFTYFTNDSWEMITTLSYGNGWPILHHSVYSKGNIYVWVIPDNYSHLYALPESALNAIRNTVSLDMPVQIEGPSQVALFTYDNDTFVVHSFHDTPVSINLVTKGAKGVTALPEGKVLNGIDKKGLAVNGHGSSWVNSVSVVLPPHSFKAFKINR